MPSCCFVGPHTTSRTHPSVLPSTPAGIAWGTGYPDLIISCPNGQSLADPTPTGQVYATVAGLLEEFMPLFRNSFVHFGGDEVENLNCWASSPKVQAFMKQMGYTDVDQVRNYFETTLQQIAANYSLTPLFWEEVYDSGYTLAPSTIIDVWLSDQELLNIIRSGNRVVESYGLYLDQQLPPGDTHYFWVDTFTNFWTHDPLAGANVTAEEAARVLGMSASQWCVRCVAATCYRAAQPSSAQLSSAPLFAACSQPSSSIRKISRNIHAIAFRILFYAVVRRLQGRTGG